MTTKTINEMDLVLDAELRKKYMEREEVLDEVKGIITLPSSELFLMKMVGDYFGVKYDTIKKLVQRNAEELASNGMKFLTYSELKEIFAGEDYEISTKGSYVFNDNCIILISFYLVENAIAKEINEKVLKYPELTERFKSAILRKSNYLIKENEVFDILQNTFNDIAKLERNVSYKGYYIDYTLTYNNINIAIECDEFGHISYNNENEEKRELSVKEECHLIRYNPDGDESITTLINNILKTIKEESL